MSKLLAVTGTELKKQLRQPGMTIVMVAGALIFTFVVGLLFGGTASERPMAVVVYDRDGAEASRTVIEALADTQGFKVTAAGAETEDPETLIREGKAAVAVVIPRGFQSGLDALAPSSVVLYGRTDTTDGLAVRQVVDRALMWLSTSRQAAGLITGRVAAARGLSPVAEAAERADVLKALDAAWGNGPQVTTTLKTVGAKTNPRDALRTVASATVAGFMVMFLMYPATFSTASILEERRQGTWRRLLTTPTRGSTLVAGKLLGVFVSSWLQAFIVIIVSRYAFGVNWGNSVPALILVVTAFVLSTIGLGLALSGFVQTMAQLGAIAPIIITGSCMLGGAFWPPEVMPKFMQTLSRFVPPGWATAGLNALIQRNAGLAGVLGPSAVLLGFAAVFLIIGVARIRYE